MANRGRSPVLAVTCAGRLLLRRCRAAESHESLYVDPRMAVPDR
jgi:hypothetical protein